MKDYKLVFAYILLFAVCTQVTGYRGPFPEKCCFRYYSKPIPLRRVARILPTSTECVKPGYLVVTKRGQSICVNPENPDVNRLISKFYFL